jgi:uncharacterized RDD family membrane protein YckC
MRALKVPPLNIPGLATPYRRLGARLIDLTIGVFILFPLSMIILGPLSTLMGDSDSNSTLFGILSMLVIVMLLVIYDTVMTALSGRTLGKMALGMRVVDINGEKPTWGQSLLRAFLLYLLGLLIVAGIIVTASILGWVFFAGLGRNQLFPHEKASKTYVMLKGHSGAVQEVHATPHDDLERLLQSGMISQDEYNRKRKEAGY